MRHRVAVVAVVALVVLAGCSGGGGSSTATEGEPTPTNTPVEPKETPIPTTSADTPADGGSTPTDAPSGSTPTASPGDSPTATPVPDDTPTATPVEASPTATPVPDDTPTATPASDDTPTATPAGSTGGPPGYDDGEFFNRTRFGQAYLQHIAEGPVAFNMTLRNSTADASQNIQFSIVNDTEETLITFNNLDQSGTLTYFVQDGTDAYRNTTSGETQYAQGNDNGIEFGAGFLQIFAVFPSLYFSAMEWDQTDTRTLDGDTYYVYESNSLNQTAFEESDWETDGSLETASGRIVMRSDGLVRDGSVTLSGTTESGTEVDVEISMSMRDDPGISVEKPDWFDESEASSSE